MTYETDTPNPQDLAPGICPDCGMTEERCDCPPPVGDCVVHSTPCRCDDSEPDDWWDQGRWDPDPHGWREELEDLQSLARSQNRLPGQF